ncbi:chain length determinant protein tyrosine kinase EpsG [Sphaerotilus hippei]|uniref:Chain length determinant protein tyrosine kinase EpsG n=1 Tax=Sphaerotilus hippei TaxID=744406 RepID=A0A318GYB2_9BURK|nr:polysaccharide biosynthesis tyrosine autokinase [Sphaerotilus hippei]PXW94953.1 chain length determinant protein tyrosine kinase EpsG [Sphaerotilus hippei]
MTASARSTFKSAGPRPVSGDDLAQHPEQDRTIGEIIRRAKNLSAEQVAAISEHQRTHNLRFGEAAVALGLATEADVVFALSQQFHYPFTPEGRNGVNRELVTASQPFSVQAEAFRAIRSQLMMRIFSATEPRRALAVVSPDSGDGKTFFAANLAVVLAQLGNRTLVVDADLRGPRLHDVFGIPNASGLSGILSGRQEDNVIFQAPDLPSLYVMPVGVTPPNPLELIERPAFRLLINELLRKFDHVIVDTPAAVHGSDFAALASRCGAALVVARKDRSRLKEIEQVVQTVMTGNATVAGVVMNEY